ncbi:hypothetical protein CSUI_004101 [Cystoisospora suis]|uniref:Transmembrane protein n=1 Tax=Cystoisospora suis TaxID=483139 RepID=A0A2C6KNI9_9APIC|nr:hypothetical protein CSUI_004101 [Cystoisospora suis]
MMPVDRRPVSPCPVPPGAGMSSGAGKQKWTILVLVSVFSGLALGLTQCIYQLQTLSRPPPLSGAEFRTNQSQQVEAPVHRAGFWELYDSGPETPSFQFPSVRAVAPSSSDRYTSTGDGLGETEAEGQKVVAPSSSPSVIADSGSVDEAVATGGKLTVQNAEPPVFSRPLHQLPEAFPEFTAVSQGSAAPTSSFFEEGVSLVFPVVSGLTVLVVLAMYAGSLTDALGFGIPLVVGGGLLSVGGVLWSYGLNSRSEIMVTAGSVCAFLASFAEIPCYVVLLLVFEPKDVPLAYALWMSSRFGSLAVSQWTLSQLIAQKLDDPVFPSSPLSTTGNHTMSASLVRHLRAGPLLETKVAEELLTNPFFFASPLWSFLHIFSVASIVGGIVLVLLIAGLYVSVASKHGELLPTYANYQQSDAPDGVSSWLHGFVHPIASNDAALLFLHEGYRSGALAGCQDGSTGWLQSHYEGIIEKQCRWSVTGCLRVIPGLFVRGRLPLYRLANVEMWKFLFSSALFVTAMGMSTETILGHDVGIAEMPMTGWLVGGHFCNTILINYTSSAQTRIWTVAAVAAPLLGSVFVSCCPHQNLRAMASMTVAFAFFLTLIGGSWIAASHVALGIALASYRIGQSQALVMAVPLSYAGLAYSMTRVAEVVASVLAPYLVSAGAHALVQIKASAGDYLFPAPTGLATDSPVFRDSLIVLKSFGGEAADTAGLTPPYGVGIAPQAAAYAFSHPSQTVAVWVFIALCVLQHFFFESFFCRIGLPRVDRLFRFDQPSDQKMLQQSHVEEAPLLPSRVEALQSQLHRQGRSMRLTPSDPRSSTSFSPVQSAGQKPVKSKRPDALVPVHGCRGSDDSRLSPSAVVGVGCGSQGTIRSSSDIPVSMPFGARRGVWGPPDEILGGENPKLSCHVFNSACHRTSQNSPAKEMCVRFVGIPEDSGRTEPGEYSWGCGNMKQEDCPPAAPWNEVAPQGHSHRYLPRRKGQWKVEQVAARQMRGIESSHVSYRCGTDDSRDCPDDGGFSWTTENATLDDCLTFRL